MVKAVIFDLDGVLIEARDWHFEALNKALELFGLGIAREDHLITFDGLPTKRKLEMLSQDRGLPRELHPFINKMKQKFTMELIYSHCRPVFHHEYALSRLKAQDIKMAVCTNSVRETLDLMLNRAGLRNYFEFTLSNEDVKTPKPDPEIYVTAINRLGLSPKQCVVVEDNPNGLTAAKASGAHVMMVESPAHVTFENINRFIDDVKAGNK